MALFVNKHQGHTKDDEFYNTSRTPIIWFSLEADDTDADDCEPLWANYNCSPSAESIRKHKAYRGFASSPNEENINKQALIQHINNNIEVIKGQCSQYDNTAIIQHLTTCCSFFATFNQNKYLQSALRTLLHSNIYIND